MEIGANNYRFLGQNLKSDFKMSVCVHMLLSLCGLEASAILSTGPILFALSQNL